MLEARDGLIRVLLSNMPQAGALAARSIAKLSAEDVGAEVMIAFEEGDIRRPIVLGRLYRGSLSRNELASAVVTVDGKPERIEITGEKEVHLRCGKASITLTPSGKIILRGTYISTRSSGVVRIKGGSVQIN